MSRHMLARRARHSLIDAVGAISAASHTQALTTAVDFTPGLDSNFNSDTPALSSDPVIAANKFSSRYLNDVTLLISIQDTSANALTSRVTNFATVAPCSTARNALIANASTAASLSAIAALPEPSAGALMFTGFDVADAIVRRQRRAPVSAAA